MELENAVIIALAAGMALFLVLWILALKSSTKARALCTEAGVERDDALARAKRAEDELRGLGNRTYIADFRPNHTYSLIAHQTTELEGQPRFFGLVRQDGGGPTPFLTRQDLGELNDGDNFTCVRDGFAKLDESTTTSAQPAAPGDATQMFAAPLRNDGEHTMMFSAAPASAPSQDPNEGLPYFKVTAGNDVGKTFPVRFERCTVGREIHNAVALHDAGASRTHCVVEYRGTGFWLSDNNSTNGTLLNGRPIQGEVLHLGDTLKLSDTEMVFTCEGHEIKAGDPDGAISAYEKTLRKAPDYVEALKTMAFLLERNLARRKEAQPLWDRIAKLEKMG